MPLALNDNPSDGSPRFSLIGYQFGSLMICLGAKFVISPRIIVALGWGAGFKPVLQKCLLSAPSFWVEGREG